MSVLRADCCPSRSQSPMAGRTAVQPRSEMTKLRRLVPASAIPKMEFPVGRNLRAEFVKSFPAGGELFKDSLDNQAELKLAYKGTMQRPKHPGKVRIIPRCI